MSSVETGQMSAAETGQMSAVETRQMLKSQIRGLASKHLGLVKSWGGHFHQKKAPAARYLSATGLDVVPILYICLVSTADICPVSAADICPVSTADICPVSTEDIYPVSTEEITAAGRRPAAVPSSVETS